MDKRQIIILLKIGKLDVSNKCIKSVTVDRNFSDVEDKFSIDIVDTPDAQISYDLELYMASGYRSMTLKYGDISEDELITFNGTIWDYTNTFVGNMKTLTITGVMSRYVTSSVGAGSYTYNIDWNNYFTKRQDETKPYGAIEVLLTNGELAEKYSEYTTVITKWYDENGMYKGETRDTEQFLSSAILNETYRQKIQEALDNSKTLTIKGPSGSIELPIPESFVALSEGELPPDIKAYMDVLDPTTYPKFYKMVVDPENTYWGPLHVLDFTNTEVPEDKQGNRFEKYPNMYLASNFLIRGYTENGYATDVGLVREITEEVLTDSHVVEFPVSLVTNPRGVYGFKLASQYFVQECFLPGIDLLGAERWARFNWDFQIPSGADYKNEHKKEKNWYNGGNKACYKGFYKKLTEKDVAKRVLNSSIDQYGQTITASYIRYATNDNGQVIAFKQWIKGMDEDDVETFVAVSKEDFEALKKSNYKATDINPEKGEHEFWEAGFGGSGRHWYKNGSLSGSVGEIIAENVGDKTNTYYFYDNDEYLRGFIIQDENGNGKTFYLQANSNALKSTYGAAGIVSSSIGVDISDIVKKLATLEGWDYDDSTIMQTELVKNCDAFVMQGQTAMEFILNNLVPKAITPIGLYIVDDPYNDDGFSYKPIKKPIGGFYPYFDENGKFHFQPLNKDDIKELKLPEELGYNFPNSPMLSFQINTKGTNFYVSPKIDYSPISLVTGEQFKGVETASDSLAKTIESTRGHNDTFDAWLGLTYNDVEKVAGDDATGEKKYETALQLAQNALVTTPDAFLLGSGSYDKTDVIGNIEKAKTKIERTVIKATLSMWGNTKVAPARKIKVTNMLKGGENNSSTPQKHASSGYYLILSMEDRIDSGGFIQNLNLVRFTDDVENGINADKIDFSKGAFYNYGTGKELVSHKTEGSPRFSFIFPNITDFFTKK